MNPHVCLFVDSVGHKNSRKGREVTLPALPSEFGALALSITDHAEDTQLILPSDPSNTRLT